MPKTTNATKQLLIHLDRENQIAKNHLLMKTKLLLQWLFTSVLFCCALFADAQKQRLQDQQESPQLKSILSAESKKGWHRFSENVKVDLKNPDQFFKDHADAFELEEGFGMMLVRHTREDNLNMEHFRFQQTYNGIPVVGAEYMLHHRQLDNDSQLKGNGTIVRKFSSGATPTISADVARAAALTQVNAKQYAWESPEHEAMIRNQKKDPDATLYPQPKLVYYSMSDDSSDPSSYRLAYEVNVFALEPMSHQVFYISAESGSVIRVVSKLHDVNTPATGVTLYNGVQSIITDVTGTQHVLKETNRAGTGTAISTYDMNNGTSVGAAVNYQNTSTDWQTEPVGVQGHWGAEKTFDYFFTTHSRNSFDNSGSEIIAYMDLGVNVNNAYWNGLYMQFGKGDGVTRTSWGSLDVVGHEFTHGVTEYSANLIYLNESGALNESFSDIFGTMIEFFAEGGSGDWLVAENVTVGGSGIRSMANPNTFGQPDTYGGTNWYIGPNDFGGVHANSGVQNFWFYLLAQGGTGTNDHGDSYAVTSIGRDAAAAIAYRNLTLYLNPTSEYADAREGAVEAAEDLFGRTSLEYAQTAQAWYAVGVGLPAYATEDLAVSSVNLTGGACDQIIVELLNSSTTATIPSGAILDVYITENGAPRPVEQIALSSAIAPGNSASIVSIQSIISTAPRVDIGVTINYAPDPEPENNSGTASVLRGSPTVGGLNPDFQSIVAVAQILQDPNLNICGHLVFKIRPGWYLGEVFLRDIRASTADHTVTLESETGNPTDVVITSQTSASVGYGTLNIYNSNYLRIRNVTIVRNSNSAFGIALTLHGIIEDVVIEGSRIVSQGTSSFNENIRFFPGGQRQNRITLRNNIFEQSRVGIGKSGTEEQAARMENIVIENNSFLNSETAIASFWGLESLTIRGNHVSFPGVTNGYGFIAGARQFLFEGNDISMTSVTTTSVFGLYVQGSQTQARVINNMISIKSSGIVTGIYLANVVSAELIHNTVKLEKTTPGSSSNSFAINATAPVTQKVILNNVIYNTIMDAVGISVNTGTLDVINYNSFYVPNGKIGRRNGSASPTLAAWQTLTGFDMNSLTYQPTFVSDVDLHLAAQHLLLKAGRATYVATDSDGDTRTLPPYVGADEYQFAPDVGVVAVRLTDQVGICQGTHVQIDIQNFHEVESVPAGTQIPVSFRVNNGVPIRETYTLPVDLPAGQMIIYTFNFVCYFEVTGTPLSARTDFVGDTNPSNDEYSISVNFHNALTVGGSNADFPTLQEAIHFIVTGQAVFCDQIIIVDMFPGTFPDPVTIDDLAGLPASASMVIQSSTRNKADVIISADKSPAIMLRGANRVTFRDLTIRYTGSKNESVISLSGDNDDITIENCDVSISLPGEGHYAINVKPGDDASLVHGLRIYNSFFEGGGINLADEHPEAGNYDIEINGNRFEGFYGHAVSMRNAGKVAIAGNTISSANPSGAINIREAKDKLDVEMNHINLAFASEAVNIESGTSSPATVSVINNFIDLVFGSPTAAGISLTGVEGHVLHNTVRLEAGSEPVPSGAAILKNYGSHVNIRSNILYSTITGMSATLISQSPNTVQDYNDIYVPNGYTGIFVDEGTSIHKTLEQWRYYTGFDLNSTDVQPVFAERDLHLAYDDALLRPDGIPAPHLATDIDGEHRNFPPCIGADEFIETGKDTKQNSAMALSVYPNPVEEDIMTLQGAVDAQGKYDISIIDSYGVLINEQKIFVEDKVLSAEIGVKDLVTGIYILRLTDPYGQFWTTRFERK